MIGVGGAQLLAATIVLLGRGAKDALQGPE